MKVREGRRWYPFVNVVPNCYRGMKDWDRLDSEVSVRLRLFHLPILVVILEVEYKERIMFALQLFCFFFRVGAYNWRIMKKKDKAAP